MPEKAKTQDSCIDKAIEAISSEKRLNLAKIARDYSVLYKILRGQLRQGKRPRTIQKPTNRVLEDYQKRALI